MVTPKTGRTSTAITAKTVSIREALGKTELHLPTIPAKITSFIQLSPSQGVGTLGRPVTGDAKRFDVSVGKTWGTDLVAAARRDAHLVPLRLIGDKANPTTPAFATVGTSSKVGAALFGPRKSDNTMRASNGDQMSIVGILFFPTENMAEIARHLKRSKLGTVINILVEFVSSPDRMANVDELMTELESIGALDDIKQLLTDEASTILEYISRLPGRLALPDVELQQVMRQITLKLTEAQSLVVAYRLFDLIGDAVAIEQQIAQTSRVIDAIVKVRPGILPTVTPAEILTNRETVPGIIASRLYGATNPHRIIDVLGETRFYPITEAGWKKIWESNTMLVSVIDTHLLGALRAMNDFHRTMDYRGSPMSDQVKTYVRYRKNLKVVTRMLPILRSLGRNEDAQPYQRKLDTLTAAVTERMGDPMNAVNTLLEAHRLDPDKTIEALETALELMPTDAEWQAIQNRFPKTKQVLSFEIDHGVGQMTMAAIEIEMDISMGTEPETIRGLKVKFAKLQRRMNRLMSIAEHFMHPVELEAYRSQIETTVFSVGTL